MVFLGARGALLLVCATLSALMGNEGSAAATPRHDIAFAAGTGLSTHVVLRNGVSARACRSAIRMKERVSQNVFFDSHAHPSSEPRIGSRHFIQDHRGLGVQMEKPLKHSTLGQPMASQIVESHLASESMLPPPKASETSVAQPLAVQPVAAQRVVGELIAAKLEATYEEAFSKAELPLEEAPADHSLHEFPTLLGSRRIHSISEVVSHPELSEDIAPGAGQILGSRRLGSFHQLLWHGAQGAPGFFQGAAGAAGEVSLPNQARSRACF